MKKILFVALLTVSAVPFAGIKATPYAMYDDDARHVPASNVPDAVINKFNQKFPNARNVKWEVNREDGRKVFEAEFTKGGGNKWKAEFLANGVFLEAHPS